MKNQIVFRRRLAAAVTAAAAALGSLPGRADSPLENSGGETFAPSAVDREVWPGWAPDLPQVRAGPGRGPRLVFRDRVDAHWLGDNTRFWYRNDLAGGAREFILVDAAKGLRQSAFDHARLATSLSKAASREMFADRLPFSAFEFTPDAGAIRFKLDDTVWQCELASYACSKLEGVTLTLPEDDTTASGARSARGTENAAASGRGARGESPDGGWSAFIRDHNLFVRAKDGGAERQLSHDGTKEMPYSRASWSPDAKTVVAFRTEPAERKEV